MKKFLYLIIIIFTVSCQNTTSPHQPPARLGEELEIKFDQKITIPEEQITIKFRDVLEDSRCPEGEACFWAGNAKIAIQLNEKEADLNTYLDPKRTTISNYNVELISVNPYPKYKVEVQKKEYIARLIITKT